MNDEQTGVDDKKALDSTDIVADDSKLALEEQKSVKQLSQNQNTDGKSSMHVKVYSPFRDYYDGQAFSISAKNLTGPFDILPKHHNFISLLSPCEITIRTVKDNEEPVRIRISGGILHVKADEVLVFLDV